MRYTNKTNFRPGLLAVLCILAMALPIRAVAADVSEADFKSLKDVVEKLSEKVEKLEQLHSTDQQTHQKDQEQIKKLQDKLGETQATAADAARRAEVAAQVQPQPVYRVPDDSGSVNKNFMILGDAEFQYAKFHGDHGTFLFADFAPIFLYRAGDNILFEAGFDFTLQNGSTGDHDSGQTTGINLSFAQLDYIINDYVTLAVGNILLPLGTYSQRTAAGWLNKFPDDPMPRDLLPGTGIGAQLLGAIPIGHQGKLINYSVYGVNGPSSSDGTGSPASLDLGGNVGLRSDNRIANLHGQPSGGARLGAFFPFLPHYDLEVGISGQTGEWDDRGKHQWTAGVFDASLHVGPFLEVKGEYIRSQFGSDSGTVRPRGWWVQAAYKLAGLNLEFPGINNVEVLGRYDTINDGLGTHTRRESLGLIYFLTNTLLIEGAYEFRKGTDPGQQGDVFLLQLGYGF